MSHVDAPPTPPGHISLKRRVLNAGAWALTGHGLNLAIRFGSNLLLTRLLVPEMFGVMAIGMIVITGLAMFSDIGLTQSIVRSQRGDDPAFLNTAWSVQILRGLLLWLVALVISMLVLFVGRLGFLNSDSVYGNPSLPYVIAVLSFNALIGGLTSTKIALAGRSLAIGRLTQIEIASQIAGLLSMLVWIAFDRSIWALVAGSIVAAFARMFLSHVWLPGSRNRWQWDSAAVVEIFGFGKWVFLSSILGFLLINGDRLLLGGMIDATALGIYTIAVTIFSLLEQVMTRVIGTAAFPALSEIARERRHDLKAGYYKFHRVIAAAAYTSSGILIASGQSLINVLYDRRYADAGWMLEILAVGLLATPLQISIQCFMALGMPHIHSRILAVRLIGLVVALPLGFYFFGLAGAVWGIVLSQFLGLPTIVTYSVKHGIADVKQELLLLPMLAVGLVGGTLLASMLKHWNAV
jgi:O-antigen/teichoic acid export membrane protein